MKIAHTAPFGPNQFGIYEAARDMIKADVIAGHEVYFIDTGLKINGKPTYEPVGTADDRIGFKIVTSSPETLNYVDIIVAHTLPPIEWGINSDIPIIYIVHDRPLYSFKINQIDTKSYVNTIKTSRLTQVKKMVYFWPEFKPFWDSVFPLEKNVCLNYPAVDQKRFNPHGNQHVIEDKHKGEFNILICDSWGREIDLFETINGAIQVAKKHKNVKFHIYGVQHNNKLISPEYSALLSILNEEGGLGELRPRVSNMENIYRGMDAVLTPHRIVTRVIGEALSCGTPVIADNKCSVSQFHFDPHDPYDAVRIIEDFINSNQEENRNIALAQSKNLCLENYLNNINEIYKEVYSDKVGNNIPTTIKEDNFTFDNLSVIIPFRPITEERKRIFEWVYERTKKILKGAEVIIGSDDRNSTPHFNKSMAINDGISKATREYILMLDADLFIDYDNFKTAYQLIDTKPFIILFNKGKYLSKETSERLLLNNLDINYFDFERNNNEILGECVISVGGAIMFHRSKFLSMYGCDERLNGWGYEDNIFHDVYSTLYGKPTILNTYMYHIHHSHANQNTEQYYRKDNYMNYEYTLALLNNPADNNKNIYQEYCKYKDNKEELIHYIKNNCSSIFKNDNDQMSTLESFKTIPKKIHIVWIGDESKRPDNCIQTWRDMNPTWEVQVWGNKEYNEYNWINKKHMSDMWSRELNGVADIMRYEILYNEGGFAVDADSICLNAIPDEFCHNECFTCYENEVVRQDLLAAGYLASVQGCDLMKHIINDIKNKTSVVDKSAWITVGPQELTNIYKRHNYKQLKIYPSHYFIPEHFTGQKYIGNDKIYATQLWGSTKKAYNEIYKKIIPTGR